MTKVLKTWTSMGVALIGGLEIAHAAPPALLSDYTKPAFILIEDDGGEGGGEGGGGGVTSYKLDSSDATAFAYDATPQTKAYVDLVHASYEESVVEAKKLAVNIGKLLAEPSAETLAAARAAWVSARPAYLKTETFRFYDGPIEAIEGEINAWPMNEAYIDYVDGKPDAGIINGKDAVDIASITAANQKSDEADVTTGWHAIEFLLWGQDLSLNGPGTRPYTDFVSDQGNNNRRREFLQSVTEKLVTDLEALAGAWAPNLSSNYRETFEKLDQRDALGRIINGMAILAGFEFMSERLGVALDSGDQEDEHSCFSDTTKQDFVQDLEGIKQVWYRAKIGELVATRDVELAKRVSALFLDAEVKVGRLGNPWDNVLASPKDSPQRKDAEAVVAALQALADGLKDVGTKLGVLVLIPSG